MNIFITGRPGSGKSRLIAALVEDARRAAKRIAGIITPELRKGGVRAGFEIIDLVSGQKEILASTELKAGPMISKYRVNVPGIDRIVKRFLESARDAEIIFIDEIGKMEFYSEKFRDALEDTLNSSKLVIATLGLPLAPRFKMRGKLITLKRAELEATRAQLKKIIEDTGL